ncbi:MAG: hypothetical protein IKV41_02540 [Oscillospiraceae bacterium]|nr:hypothetical protein [Oscillospiraceae bacterium]
MYQHCNLNKEGASLITVITTNIGEKKGFFHRIIDYFRPLVSVKVRCYYPKFSYNLIHCSSRRTSELTSLIASIPFGEIITSDDISLPEKLKRYEVPALPFKQRITENTVRKLLEECHHTPHEQRLGIIDADALCLEAAERFVKLCPNIKIVTNHPGIYKVFAREMLEEYGAVIMVSESPETLADRTVIFCPSDYTWTKTPLCITAPILAADKCSISGSCTVIDNLKPNLPAQFLDNVPTGISPERFAQAVYRKHPDCFLRECIAKSGTCLGKQSSIKDISGYIKLNLQKVRSEPQNLKTDTLAEQTAFIP